MTEQFADKRDYSGDRHLSLVHTEPHEIEYDEDFVSPAGVDIRIVFQGKDVVKNRNQLLAKLAHQSIEL